MLDGMSENVGTVGKSTGPAGVGMSFQQTIKTAISCRGVGLHSGEPVAMTLHPAPAGHGVVFRRTDLDEGSNEIPARYDAVTNTTLCSTITNESGASVATIEHLMSAIAGLGIDNLLVELDGPEVPVMDGSAEPFAFLLDCAGTIEQDTPRKAIRILRDVTVNTGSSTVTISPADEFLVEMVIDFNSEAIGRQSLAVEVSPALFRSDIAKARTFGFLHEVEAMRKAGLGRGGSLENAVVIDGDRVMNDEGLRFADEFVRHKILDCIGDLALAGYPILGHVVADKAGHAINNKLLHAVFADPANWEIVDVDALPVGGAFLSAAE